MRTAAIVRSLVVCLLSAGVLSACSDSSKKQESTATTTAAEPSATQTVTGQAPAASSDGSAFVVLEPVGGGPAPEQASTPSMDQEQQTFIPNVLLVRTGQPVRFLNHDDVLHNVRVRNDETRESAFNVAIPTGEAYMHTFQRDGFYDVGCDIHPGMSALIFSSTSPYAVMADASGAFSIPNVPNGPYKATAYAGDKRIDKEIVVGPGSATIELK